MASRLQEKYMKEVAPALMEKFGYKNVMEIPKLDKIVINMGIGDARENPKGLEKAVEEMAPNPPPARPLASPTKNPSE